MREHATIAILALLVLIVPLQTVDLPFAFGAGVLIAVTAAMAASARYRAAGGTVERILRRAVVAALVAEFVLPVALLGTSHV